MQAVKLKMRLIRTNAIHHFKKIHNGLEFHRITVNLNYLSKPVNLAGKVAA
jgi:hypothetical protein